MEVPEHLLCLFHAQVKERDGSYLIEIPAQEVTDGAIEREEVHRVALLSQAPQAAATAESKPAAERERDELPPPVEKDEVVDVEIEDIGDQGDGIARVGPGYVVIVPGATRGETVTVEMTEVRETMAFAEMVEPHEDDERADEDPGEESTDEDEEDEEGGIFSWLG